MVPALSFSNILKKSQGAAANYKKSNLTLSRKCQGRELGSRCHKRTPMLRKWGEILDTGYYSHTVDAATRVQRTHSLGGQASTYPATVLACQARGTLTSTPADGGHRGSKCVHTDAEPVLKSPLQKACPQVEFGCIPGNQLHFGKEMKVKERKQSECGPSLPLGRRGPGCCTISGSQPVPRTLPGALEGRLCIKSWQHIPMEGSQAALHSPPDSGNTSSADP